MEQAYVAWKESCTVPDHPKRCPKCGCKVQLWHYGLDSGTAAFMCSNLEVRHVSVDLKQGFIICQRPQSQPRVAAKQNLIIFNSGTIYFIEVGAATFLNVGSQPQSAEICHH